MTLKQCLEKTNWHPHTIGNMYRLDFGVVNMVKEDASGTIMTSERSDPGLLDLSALEIKKLDRLPPPESKVSQKCPHKKTDFRYKIWVKERKVSFIWVTVAFLETVCCVLLNLQNKP